MSSVVDKLTKTVRSKPTIGSGQTDNEPQRAI